MEFPQNHMAERHGEGGIGAGRRVEPEVGEFRRFRIVGADHHGFRPPVPRLRIEMRVRCPGLRHVRAPEDQESRIVPVGAFGNVGLFAPGLRRCRRQIAIPVVKRHADAAHQRQVARAGGVGDHGHRGNGRETDYPVRAIGLCGIGVGRRDDLVDLGPVGADEAAESAFACVGCALCRILDDGFPGGDRAERLARLAPQLDEPRTHERIFHPIAGIEIPAIARASGAAARLVVRQVRPGARIVGLLRFPGDDPALDVDLPGARTGAIDPMGRAHDFVVLPALAVASLPVAVLAGGDAVAIGKFTDVFCREEVQSVQQVAHRNFPLSGVSTVRGRCGAYRKSR